MAFPRRVSGGISALRARPPRVRSSSRLAPAVWIFCSVLKESRERKSKQLCLAKVPWYIRMSDGQISTYTIPPDHPPICREAESRDNGSGNASGQRKIAARGSGQRRAETTEAGRGRGRGGGSGKICRISDLNMIFQELSDF